MLMKNRTALAISIILLLIGAYLIMDSILFDGVKPKQINVDGFQANYYTLESTSNQSAIVLIGGSHWGDYWGVEFARKGFVGLSLPYTRQEGLPDLPEEIPLEYFQRAIEWLQNQPAVNPDKIVVMGASRNAELALVIASTFPELVNGVVAYAPSSVSWSNTVLPFNSDSIKPSWTYQGKDIPYIPMEKVSGGNTPNINTFDYWSNGLLKQDAIPEAVIPVENINGPILLFSGKDDRVWPSAEMADQIDKRLNDNNFIHPFKNIQYENAGHLISGNPNSDSAPRTGQMNIQGKSYTFEYGGTVEGDSKAKLDAKTRVFQLIENL